MSKANTFETDLLKLVFQNIALALIGDASGLQPSTTAGSLYVGLYASDPGEAGDQTTNELSYPGYARVAVARSTGGWTVSGAQVSNTASVAFGQNTGGAVTAAFVGVGTAASGAGKLLYSGELLGPEIVVTIDTATDKFLATSHGLTNGQAVRVRVSDGSLPGGVSSGTQYFVVNAGTNDFQISTTVGGSAVDLTSVGSGTIVVRRDFYLAIGTNVTPSFSVGQCILIED